MQPSHYTALLEHLYRLARQPERWPELIDQLETLCEEEDPSELLQRLAPHLEGVARLQGRLAVGRRALRDGQRVLEMLPQPLALLGPDLRLLAANAPFHRQLARHDGNLDLHQGRLQSPERELEASLRDHFATATSQQVLTHLPLAPDGQLVITPLLNEQAETIALLVTLLLSHQRLDLDRQGFAERYALTPAELRLAQGLASGYNLEECATQFERALTTLRTQLNALLAKTGCSNQGELIHLLLRDPLLLGPQNQDAVRITCSERDARHLLPDGREIGYARYGQPGGIPLVHLHGISGCRLQLPPEMDQTQLQGITLYLPERPGYGLSSPHPGHDMLSWGDDLLHFIQQVIGTPVILSGFTTGARHAITFAGRHPEWVRHLLLVSPTSPYDFKPRSLRHRSYYHMMRALLRVPPPLLIPLASTLAQSAQAAPAEFLTLRGHRMTHSERDYLARPSVRRALVRVMDESSRQGYEHYAEELLRMARPWEVQPEAVRCASTLWHGGRDQYIPGDMVQRLAERLGQSELRWVDEASHLLFFTHWPQVLERCRAVAQASPPESAERYTRREPPCPAPMRCPPAYWGP